MEYKDYYKILGVSKTASKEDIRKSYKKLARKYHPDVSKEKDAEARFKEVSEAYEVLSDAAKRSQYDQMGSGGFHGDPFGARGGGAHGGFSGGFGGFGGGNNTGYSDFFDSFFGGGVGGGHTRSRKPEAQTATVYLDLEDVFEGNTKRIRVQGGDSLQVKIPKGIEEGKKIRLAGKANNGGDLLLKVKFNTHPKYRVENKDVYLDYPIAPWEAALGGSVTVPTLNGSIKLKIPAGAKAGSKMRLKGRGLPGSMPGDQYVVLRVVTPEAKTEEQRAFYQQMQEMFAWDPRQSM
ncbi:DnaJ C-terminal domain-containing protein [Leucothrix pacifica]|uniref:Cytochrome C biogenesis protein n=1 Tax=Leucothrix pacifica TaxID=1247513 RepID=A0A317CLE9_9GAMM|nr:DnaJ C-terminal domain-containing protein [Leucothrix pacifica]PWQ99424.1 cytochrome C biogenesis protein [Leucothrix pacifica]